MIILEPHSRESGWITCIIEGRWVQAKVYDDPSTYGIKNGRVSKLSIGKTNTRNPNQPFHDQMAMHYDRGMDFNRLGSRKMLNKIVAELEALPKLFGDQSC